jgi:hypothetical protein
MITLIKKTTQTTPTITVGDIVEYVDRWHDGRSYENTTYRGTVVKVNRVTVDFETVNGNTYRVKKGEVTKLI